MKGIRHVKQFFKNIHSLAGHGAPFCVFYASGKGKAGRITARAVEGDMIK